MNNAIAVKVAARRREADDIASFERARNDQFTPCCSRASSPLPVLDL